MWLWNSCYRLALDLLMSKSFKLDNSRVQMELLKFELELAWRGKQIRKPNKSIGVLNFVFFCIWSPTGFDYWMPICCHH